jgi:hypothetical protein
MQGIPTHNRILNRVQNVTTITGFSGATRRIRTDELLITNSRSRAFLSQIDLSPQLKELSGAALLTAFSKTDLIAGVCRVL